MHYCPYCGSIVKEEEHFCINCGKKLPIDINNRIVRKKTLTKIWFVPLLTIIVVAVGIIIHQILLQNLTASAIESYTQGEQEVINGNYKSAIVSFEEATSYSRTFPQAIIATDFVKKALSIEEIISRAYELSRENQYQEALTILNKAENDLNKYNGTAVNVLIENIDNVYNSIKVAQLYNKLEENPSIDELKTILWDAESVGDQATEITERIRSQIIDFSFSKASELINEKQFSDAFFVVEDALKYAPESEKLNSLKTTIDKEKIAFETAQQQRIEQALNIAQADQEVNEKDAVHLNSADLTQDDKGNIVVTGEVKSVATIPINSILVQYSLSTKSGKELASNQIFIFPDTLYPDETGNFEFTHFELNEDITNLELTVKKITWYTD